MKLHICYSVVVDVVVGVSGVSGVSGVGVVFFVVVCCGIGAMYFCC